MHRLLPPEPPDGDEEALSIKAVLEVVSALASSAGLASGESATVRTRPAISGRITSDRRARIAPVS